MELENELGERVDASELTQRQWWRLLICVSRGRKLAWDLVFEPLYFGSQQEDEEDDETFDLCLPLGCQPQ